MFGLAAGSRWRAARADVVRILPEYGVSGVDLHLVSPPKAYEPARVALLRNFLAERFAPLLKACQSANHAGAASAAA